ncbi:MocR-like pyridoxine biosynthesis transcription factor PdxR, partial [Senegalimassilia anaerobia]
MELRGDLALYEYLYSCIRHDIAHGKVKPGQKLPSKRTLAKQLGVSLITIEAAYDQLVAEGYIRSRERCGYYACDLAPAAKIEEPRSARHRAEAAKATATNGGRENHAANPNGPQPVSQDGERPKSSTDYRPTIDSAAAPSDADFVPTIDGSAAPCPQNTPSDAPLLADFTHSTLATTMLPYSAWAKAVRRTLSDESAASLAEAASAAGSPELRSAIADHLRQYRGMGVSPDQVIIGAGSQTLYQLLVQLLGRTRRYAVENPGYPLLTRMYEQQDAQVTHIGLDDSGIDIDALEASGASVAHIMPSHQFPTGIVTTAARRRELLNWAREGDRYLIEDDYDSEFRMAGRPIPSLFGIDAAERVLYLNSFAKSLGAAFRMAYLVLPPQLAQRFRKQLGF